MSTFIKIIEIFNFWPLFVSMLTAYRYSIAAVKVSRIYMYCNKPYHLALRLFLSIVTTAHQSKNVAPLAYEKKGRYLHTLSPVHAHLIERQVQYRHSGKYPAALVDFKINFSIGWFLSCAWAREDQSLWCVIYFLSNTSTSA